MVTLLPALGKEKGKENAGMEKDAGGPVRVLMEVWVRVVQEMVWWMSVMSVGWGGEGAREESVRDDEGESDMFGEGSEMTGDGLDGGDPVNEEELGNVNTEGDGLLAAVLTYPLGEPVAVGLEPAPNVVVVVIVVETSVNVIVKTVGEAELAPAAVELLRPGVTTKPGVETPAATEEELASKPIVVLD